MKVIKAILKFIWTLIKKFFSLIFEIPGIILLAVGSILYIVSIAIEEPENTSKMTKGIFKTFKTK